MIKSKFTLFQVQMKRRFTHATKPTEPRLGITPKTFNTIDMRPFLNKFIISMVDAKMFLVTQIDQPIIPSPSIRMDDTFKLYTSSDDGLKRLSGAIGDDFSIDLPISLENTKDYRLPQGPSPTSASYATSAEITLINFNLTGKG